MLNLKINTVLIGKNKDIKKMLPVLNEIDEISLAGTANSVKKGISLISDFPPDLVLVDVKLKDMNGIELVRTLHNRNIFPEVIFLADDEKDAYGTLEVKPFDYLVKPVNKISIEQSIIRLKNKFRKRELMRKMDLFSSMNSVEKKRIFKQKGGIIIIPLEEIVYCKAELIKTILVLRNGNEVQLNSGISQTLESINSDDFTRVGRSYCINRNYLRKIDKRQSKCFLYHEGKSWKIPVSKNTLVQLEKLNVSALH